MTMRIATAEQVYPTVDQFDLFVIDWDKLPQFKETEFSDLRYHLMVAMLSSLKDTRVSAEQKADARAWVMSDDITPFSFRICCESEGVHFEEMRELILDHIKR